MSLPPAKGFALVGGLARAGGRGRGGGRGGGRSPEIDRSIDPRRLAFSYLIGLMFVTSVSVGALAWVMLHHLTGAVWSVVIRRLLENLTRPLPWIAILFIPVALNLGRLYPWADPSRVAADPGLARKAVWLNPLFFTVRSAVYLASWALVAGLLARSSARQDRTGDPAEGRRMRATSAWGMVVLGADDELRRVRLVDVARSALVLDDLRRLLLGGLAASARSPPWSCSCSGCGPPGGCGRRSRVEHLHDLGKLLFGFVIFWAYIAFCQYFLIWYANFPEETRWYVTRRSGTWNTLSWSLVFGHFVVPFVLLLFRATKRSPFWLGFIAAWILVFHYIDLYWLIMPALRPEGVEPNWLDASLLLTLVFTCGAIVARACQARPLVPIGDPRLAESLAFRNP